MTTIQLSDEQYAQFTAAGLIVVDGERIVDHADNRPPLNSSSERGLQPDNQADGLRIDGRVAPELWRKLTEPCATCGGIQAVASPHQTRSAFGTIHSRDLAPCPNPDCDRGRQVVTLTATCPRCRGTRSLPFDGPGHCPSWACPCGTGVVTLGRFTIRLLPIVGDGHIVPGEDYVEAGDGVEVVLWEFIPAGTEPEAHQSKFLFDAPDNQPQPGQWAVVFEPVAALTGNGAPARPVDPGAKLL